MIVTFVLIVVSFIFSVIILFTNYYAILMSLRSFYLKYLSEIQQTLSKLTPLGPAVVRP